MFFFYSLNCGIESINPVIVWVYNIGPEVMVIHGLGPNQWVKQALSTNMLLTHSGECVPCLLVGTVFKHYEINNINITY